MDMALGVTMAIRAIPLLTMSCVGLVEGHVLYIQSDSVAQDGHDLHRRYGLATRRNNTRCIHIIQHTIIPSLSTIGICTTTNHIFVGRKIHPTE